MIVDSQLLKKLKIKQGHKMLLINAPEEYEKQLLGEAASMDLNVETQQNEDSSPYDVVQLFVHNVKELEQYAPVVIESIQYNGLLWISYPKKSSKIKTDISRDQGWEPIAKAGFDGIALISIDETWSAMRFRPVELVKLKEGTKRKPLATKTIQEQ